MVPHSPPDRSIPMNERIPETIGRTPRRTFIRRVAGALSVGLAAAVAGPCGRNPQDRPANQIGPEC